MSRRLLAVALAAGLLGGALVMPAEAAKKKKPKKAVPVATTLYMEGESNFGEEDQYLNATPMKLQPAEGSGEKSRGFWGAATSPNPNCAVNSHLPVFIGNVSGTVSGSMTITFDAISTPGNAVEVRVWPDVGSQLCNDEYVEPAGKVTVPLPAGQGAVEATIEGLNFTSVGLMTIQINPVGIPPGYARVFYGTAESKVEFSCLPAKGAASCLPS